VASKSKNGIEAANGKFRFVFRANGEKQRGPWVDSHKEAKRLEGERKAKLRKAASSTKVVGTVAELIDIYVTRRAIDAKTGKPAWGATKSHELRRIQEDDMVGSLQVADITAARMVRWGEKLAETLAASTVLNRVSYLNGVLNTAKNRWATEGLCNALVCSEMEAAIAIMREEEIAGPGIPRNRMATREEIARVREAARDSTSHVDLVAIIDVLSRMPLRMGELLKLTAADLAVLGEATLRGRKHPNRRIKERIVEVVPLIICPMTGVNTYELVASRVPAGAAPDFRPFNFEGQNVSNAWIAACKRAGVEGLTLHDLRAYSITNLLGGGIDSITVAKLSGHKNPKTMAAHYSRQNSAMIAATIRNNFKAAEALTAADIRQMIATLQRELAVAEAREAASGPQLKLAA
jgi:integrase